MPIPAKARERTSPTPTTGPKVLPTTLNPAFGAEDEADGKPLKLSVSGWNTSHPSWDRAYPAEEVDGALGIPPVDLETEEVGPMVVVLVTVSYKLGPRTHRRRGSSRRADADEMRQSGPERTLSLLNLE